MIYRTEPEKIQEYYDYPAINQSGLKVILKDGIQIFKAQEEVIKGDMYYEEKAHFVIGKAIDCYITEGKEEFKRQFFISTLQKKPSDTLMSLLQMTFDNSTLTDSDDISLNGFKEILHQSLKNHVDEKGKQLYYDNRKKDNWQDDTRITSILDNTVNHQYWNELIEANGKQILSDTEKAIVLGSEDRIGIVPSFLNHPNTRFLFDEKLENSRDIDIVYQFPIYESIDDIYTKKLLDCIYIDHLKKIIRPLDIKSTREPVLMFNKAMKDRRYDLQGSFYYDSICNPLNIDKLSIRTRKDLRGYRVANFAFVVESTSLPGTPMIFPMGDDMLQHGRVGNGIYLLGYKQGLDIYKKWLELDFTIERMYPNGVLFIDNNFEYRV